MKVLVTGCAGFIGFFSCLELMKRGATVVGLDSLNDYYDVKLKEDRLALLKQDAGFSFHQIDITDTQALMSMFETERIERVLHLAAQAGVRYSLKNPHAYAQANLVGFTNILEAARAFKVDHLVYASTSSVYGGNQKLPFSEHDTVDHPVSFYAATKRANELMAHSYSHLYRLPTTALRFFTVYGPWGRPDMSPMLFAKAIMEGEPIRVFNNGDMARDFTYIDDIVAGIVRVLDRPATPDAAFDPRAPDPASSSAPFRIYNIGNHTAVNLREYIETLESILGRRSEKILMPMQDGDVQATYADVSLINDAAGFAPATPLRLGLERFAVWFKSYYRY
jgi:UDP-glucuronate 4-epimerase